MAWQVLLLKLPDSLTGLAALPADYVPPPIGAPEHVADRIHAAAERACPVETETVSHRLVVMRNDEFVIEAELGGTIDVDRVLLHVLGSEAALPLVSALARELDTSAIDCETDAVLDPDVLPDTLRQWQTRIEDLR
jgi:hypothetical protein